MPGLMRLAHSTRCQCSPAVRAENHPGHASQGMHAMAALPLLQPSRCQTASSISSRTWRSTCSRRNPEGCSTPLWCFPRHCPAWAPKEWSRKCLWEQTLRTQHWSGLSHFQEGTDQLEGSHSLSLSHSSQLLASQGGSRSLASQKDS